VLGAPSANCCRSSKDWACERIWQLLGPSIPGRGSPCPGTQNSLRTGLERSLSSCPGAVFLGLWGWSLDSYCCRQAYRVAILCERSSSLKN
jgi:hypothetical protein